MPGCVIVVCPCIQGMIEPGEVVSETLKREFGEEAMNSLEADADEKAKLKTQVAEFFRNGLEVYCTPAFHFHFIYFIFYAFVFSATTHPVLLAILFILGHPLFWYLCSVSQLGPY